MSLFETTPDRPERGLQRIVIRGPLRLSEAQQRLMRPAYNEYPQRNPLNPRFPQPGRRGGSAVRRVQGEAQAPPGGAAIVVAEGGEGEFPPEQNVYPPAFEPRANPLPSGSGGDLPASAAGAAACPIEDGDTVYSSPGVPMNSVIVSVSRAVSRPFNIVHLSYWAAVAAPNSGTSIALRILTSDDNNSEANFNTSGDNILDLTTQGLFEPFEVRQHHYPNKLVSKSSQFIKFVWRNNTGATVEVLALVDIRYVSGV